MIGIILYPNLSIIPILYPKMKKCVSRRPRNNGSAGRGRFVPPSSVPGPASAAVV